MNKLVFAMSFVLTIILFPNLSQALLIGYSEEGGNFATSLEPATPSVFLTHLFIETGAVSSPKYSPFGEIEIDTSDVGLAWLADNSTTDFASSLTLLTNGINNIVGYSTPEFGGSASETVSRPHFSIPNSLVSDIKSSGSFLGWYTKK